MPFEQFIPSAGLAEIFERTTTHHFGQTFGSILDILNTDEFWNEEDQGEPRPIEYDIFSDEPYNWYTQEWANCTFIKRPVNWDGYVFQDLFADVHYIENDYTIFDIHHLNWY
jgi:hypothetical protein